LRSVPPLADATAPDGASAPAGDADAVL
jgi:hypothetical protein